LKKNKKIVLLWFYTKNNQITTSKKTVFIHNLSFIIYHSALKIMEYNPQDIEKKWQDIWKKNNTYKVIIDHTKPKFYALDMFPYPSGAGLHVGHPLGYIATDIMARYKRMTGHSVLHPMGFDSFGLPAEQYAIETGQHPAITTKQNIETFKNQLSKIGFDYDWEREIQTSSPQYYKWTQFIFQEIFESWYNNDTKKAQHINTLIAHFEKNGNTNLNAVCDEDTPQFSAKQWQKFSEKEQQEILLKYRLTFIADSFVNWCPALGTVLANDEVKDGLSERGGHPVERKKMRQWMMRITAYADRLLEGLEGLDWSDALKEMQRNWIGKSTGCEIDFKVNDKNITLTAFTTRIDTIFGVSYLVLAPEHEIIGELTTLAQKNDVEKYVTWAKNRSERERQTEVKSVSGVFTGSYATNPFSDEKIPIWIADYVLSGYGTGVVMGVPSSDDRDFRFANNFNLPIKMVIEGTESMENPTEKKYGKMINSDFLNGLETKDAITKAISFVKEHNIGKAKVNFRLRDAVFSRQRYWGEPVPVYFKNGIPYLVPKENLPLTLPEISAYKPTKDGEPPLARATDWAYKSQDYFHIEAIKNKEVKYNESYENHYNHELKKENEEIENCTYLEKENSWLLESKTKNYKIKCLMSREYFEKNIFQYLPSLFPKADVNYWHYIFEMKFINVFVNANSKKNETISLQKNLKKRKIGKIEINGKTVYEDFRLLSNSNPNYINFGKTYPKSNLSLIPESVWRTLNLKFISEKKPYPYEHSTMPGWAGSSWYFLRYMDANNENKLVSKEAMQYWQQVDLYVGGTEHAVGHLLYSRFWTKFLFDRGFINFDEPFKKLVNQGMIQGRSALIYRKKGENVYVDSELAKNYNQDELQQLHVDVNIVKNDILDIEAYKNWRNDDEWKKEMQNATFLVNEKDNENPEFHCDYLVEKMSKRWYNVVNPDDVIARYSADTLRLYEMFLGPLEQSKPWNTQGIDGTQRFLRKLWRLFYDEKDNFLVNEENPLPAELKSLHKLLKGMHEEIAEYSFNTIVSKYMIAVNELTDLKCNKKAILMPLLQALAPFAPHITEELWEKLGNEMSIHHSQMPDFEEKYLVESTFEYPISVNGKVRTQMLFDLEKPTTEIEQEVLKNDIIEKWLEGKAPKKIIVVKGRIVNVVI
jgi:leucyl-tRNA synthetase